MGWLHDLQIMRTRRHEGAPSNGPARLRELRAAPALAVPGAYVHLPEVEGEIVNLILPWPPKELSPNARTYWRKRAPIARSYREACYVLAKQSGVVIDWTGDIHAWIDFYPPDKRQRDDDNMIAAFKSGRDGLADALGVNDRRFRIHPYVKSEVGGMVKVRFTRGPEATA